jgi:DNA-binding transcriptional LysR family regulator
LLDVRRLRVLRELAARGTIAATAEALSFTPPAISQQLATLEREVGVTLLEREGRSVRLTDAARTLVRHTETVLAQLEAAEADLAGQAGAVAGRLRVAAFQTAAKTFVAAMVAELRRDHPGLELAVDDLEPADSLSALRLSELDVAVVHEYPFAPRTRHPGLVFTDLMDDPLHVAVSSGDPLAKRSAISLSDLAGATWIAGHEGTACHDIVVRAGRAAGFEPTIAGHTNDFTLVYELIAAGLGISLIPGIAVEPDRSGVRTLPLVAPTLSRRIFAAVRAGSELRPSVRAALAYAQNAASSRANPTGSS